MSIVFNAASAANVSILKSTNAAFQTSQKRVATGKAIFSAADDSTRYTMSQTMLSRAKNINAVNNNISTTLKTLESTDAALKQIRGMLGQMVDLATKAANAGASTTIIAGPAAGFAGIQETTAVAGVAANHRLSITADDGKNFTFTVGAAGTTNWGQVSQALAAANIGVELKFDTASSSMQLRSTNGTTGFRIDGSSSQQFVDDLVGVNSPYAGTYAASMFVNGSNVQPSFSNTTPYGMQFGTGGAVRSIAAVANSGVSSGSAISFVGSDGVVRTWSSGANTATAQEVVDGINAMNSGVRAEYVTGGTLQLRRTDGGTMTVVGGSGSFNNINGPARFNTVAGGSPYVTGNPVSGASNNDLRLQYGAQYDALRNDITNVVNNNVSQSGGNLLRGQGLSLILNEFATNPIAIAGVNTTVGGNLGLAALGSGWGNSGTIQSSLAQAQAAQLTIDNISSSFGTYSSFAKQRYDLNKEYASDLQTLGDDLVAADVAEESARLTALQTQQQFAVQAFTAGTSNAQSLLRLLG